MGTSPESKVQVWKLKELYNLNYMDWNHVKIYDGESRRALEQRKSCLGIDKKTNILNIIFRFVGFPVTRALIERVSAFLRYTKRHTPDVFREGSCSFFGVSEPS